MGKTNDRQIIGKNMMKNSIDKKSTMILVLALFGFNHTLQADSLNKHENSYSGLWLTDDAETIVRIKMCNKSLCGRIAGFSNSKQSDKKLTPAEEKQGIKDLKIICSTDLLGGLKEKGRQWKKGWIIDFETEKEYSLSLQRVKEHLKVRAYEGAEILGETFLWKRVDTVQVTCDSILKEEI